MNGEHPNNAVAGPSSLRSDAAVHPTAAATGPHTTTTTPPPPSSSPPTSPASLSIPHSRPSSMPLPTSVPLLFLPPPAPPPPKQHLASTQDLLARLQLLPAYDKYVRPLVVPGGDNVEPSSSGGLDKGKGRELPGGGDVEMADAQDGDDDDGVGGGKGEKKKKNSYKHLIKGVPGKHSFKKDDYLTTMMLVPPKQRMRIHRFDEKTQEDAFTVSLEGLKGWNYNALVVESPQAREDRKKRKEAKRAAKLQLQTGQLPPSTSIPSAGGGGVSAFTPMGVAQPQPLQGQAPIPTTVARRGSTSQPNVGTAGGGSGTPKPGVGTPRPGSRAGNHNPAPSSNVAGGGGGVPRPTSTVPRPGSAVPRPGSAIPRPGSAVSTKPGAQGQGVVGQLKQQQGSAPKDVIMQDQQQQRGKKRERDDSTAPLVNGVLVNGNGNGAGYLNGNANTNGVSNGAGAGALPQKPPPVMVNAKAGTGNIRPRPVKRQKVDGQGHARDVTAPVQQPTPQGV